MSSKRITINKILSNENLVQENQYFQVRWGQGPAAAGGLGQRDGLGGMRMCPMSLLTSLGLPWGMAKGSGHVTEGRASFNEH